MVELVNNVPFVILAMYTAVALFIGTLGIALSFKKMAGSPFIVIFSAIMFWGAIALVNNIDVSYVDDVQYSVTHPMNVTTSDSSVAFSTTITGLAERPINVNSLLVNAKISCIEVNMIRTGSPTDNVMIGILDNDNRMVKLFGNITASSINTGTRSYQVCLGNHDYWILAYNDYVGAKHTGSVGANNIAISMNTANPFDGTNSARATYTSGSWSDTTATDLRMKLTSDNANVYGKAVPYDLNDNDFYVFFIMLGGFFMFIGVIIQMRDWT